MLIFLYFNATYSVSHDLLCGEWKPFVGVLNIGNPGEE